MRKTIFAFIMLICASTAIAQRPGRTEVSPEQRNEWMQQYRDFKHKYLTRMLDLSEEQKEAFFTVYDQMDDELAAVAQQTREIEDKYLADGVEYTDDEYTEAASELFQMKSKEAKIELEYFDRLREVLTPSQLVRLKSVEREFAKRLQKQQRHEK